MGNKDIVRKMRDYALKQALTELTEEPSEGEMQYIARRHGLTYFELKRALERSRKSEKEGR